MELKRKALGDGPKAKGKRAGNSPPGANEASSAPEPGEETHEPDPVRDEPVAGNDGAGVETGSAKADEGTAGGRAWPRFSTVLKFGAPVLGLLVLVAGIFFFLKFKPHAVLFANSSQRLEPITSIMRPIPLPDYRDMLDFLVVYEMNAQKMIVAIRMEVGFQNPTRYQNCKDQNVAFRDTIYSFLLQQNVSGTTLKTWHSIVEKDLVDYLRVKLPQSYADTIRLAQVENL
jgi:hypothetical protein